VFLFTRKLFLHGGRGLFCDLLNIRTPKKFRLQPLRQIFIERGKDAFDRRAGFSSPRARQ